MVGARADHVDFDAGLGVPAGVAVEHVHIVVRVEVVDRAFAVDLEGVWGK